MSDKYRVKTEAYRVKHLYFEYSIYAWYILPRSYEVDLMLITYSAKNFPKHISYTPVLH
jgi:hypothetical protein